MMPAFPRAPAFAASLELTDASTAEVGLGTGQLETLSAELETTLAGLRVTNAGTPSQIRSLEIRSAEETAPGHTPRQGMDPRLLLDYLGADRVSTDDDDDDAFTLSQRVFASTNGATDSRVRTTRSTDEEPFVTERDGEMDAYTKRATSDGLASTKRATEGLLSSLEPLTLAHEEPETRAHDPVMLARAAAESAPDSVQDNAPSQPYDSSELPTANIVAASLSDPHVAPPPSDGDLMTEQRRAGEGFFFEERESEPTLARDFGPASPFAGPSDAKSAPSARGTASDSLSADAFSPSNFLNESSASLPSSSAMSVRSGDMVRPVATQPIVMSPPAHGNGGGFQHSNLSSSAPGGTRVLPNAPQHSSSRPPPPQHPSSPPAPQDRARSFESGSANAYPPLRFGGEASPGYHPAPAPQWGPTPAAPPAPTPAVPLRSLPPNAMPPSEQGAPPRTLRWVALGLILGAGIVLVGYRYLLHPIDPRPIALPPAQSVATVAAPPATMDPASLPPINLQNTPMPTAPPVLPSASASAPASATAQPKAHGSWHPPSGGGRPSPKAATSGDGPSMPRPLNPDPPPAPEPMPGQSILDNAL